MTGSLTERAKVVPGRAGPATSIHGKYSVKTTAKCLLSCSFHDIIYKVCCRVFEDCLIKLCHFPQLMWTLIPAHGLVVKLSVTINCWYSRAVPEQRLNHRGRKWLPHAGDSCCVKQISCGPAFKLLRCSVCVCVCVCVWECVPLLWAQRSSPGQVGSGCPSQPQTF